MLNSKHTLLRRGGTRHAAQPEKDRTLHQLIQSAIRTSNLDLGEPSGKTTVPGGFVLLPQPAKARAIQVHLLPARSEGPLTGASFAESPLSPTPVRFHEAAPACCRTYTNSPHVARQTKRQHLRRMAIPGLPVMDGHRPPFTFHG